jgi:hypothetical protein
MMNPSNLPIIWGCIHLGRIVRYKSYLVQALKRRDDEFLKIPSAGFITGMQNDDLEKMNDLIGLELSIAGVTVIVKIKCYIEL